MIENPLAMTRIAGRLCCRAIAGASESKCPVKNILKNLAIPKTTDKTVPREEFVQ